MNAHSWFTHILSLAAVRALHGAPFHTTFHGLHKVCHHHRGTGRLCFAVWLLGLVVGMLCLATPLHAMPRSERDLRDIKEKLVETSVVYGQIPAILEPAYVPVRDAALSLASQYPVFVVFLPGGPRIYPQKILVWHEVINDEVDGHGYMITYSPISGSVAAYDRQVDGVNLIFDTQGQIYNSNSILIDRNTGSLWTQMLGMAFEGPMFGRGLKQIPVWWTTWQYASKVYPKAMVLAAPRSERKPYGRDPYGSYLTSGNYYDDQRILYPVTTPSVDRRFPLKQRILGLELDGLVLAINEAYVRERKVVNFFFGPTPMVALLDPRLNVVRVFNRTVWSKPALFLPGTNGITDMDTGTTWNYDGKALEGNLQGASLDEHTGIYAFWFAWAAFHPETLMVPGPSVVPDSALRKGIE